MKEYHHYVLQASVALMLALPSSLALAQTPPPGGGAIDPRLAAPTITALQGLLSMREAQLRALHDDTEKTIAELRAKCGDRCQDKTGDASGASATPAPTASTSPPPSSGAPAEPPVAAASLPAAETPGGAARDALRRRMLPMVRPETKPESPPQ